MLRPGTIDALITTDSPYAVKLFEKHKNKKKNQAQKPKKPKPVDKIKEATICFILLRFLVYVRKVDGKESGNPLNPLFENVTNAWLTFLNGK